MATEYRLYSLLGLEKSASVDDVKKAYRTLARTHHPDKNLNDPGAAQKFQEIQYAYSILSDESKRAIYDLHGESAARKFDEQGRNSHTVFSPNPLLARRIWIFFFGFWLACVLLDPFIGVPLEWILITFGLPLAFLYFFGRKNFPWRFMWSLIVDFLLYFILPSGVLARLANILIYSACVITISLLGADPAFAAGSIFILGYIDIFWRSVPLNGMFMAAHSATAGAVVLLAITMMLSEEGAHKYMVDVLQYFLPLVSFVAWWIVQLLNWLLPWLGPWEWLPFVVFWAWAHISSIPGTNWGQLRSQLTLAGGIELGIIFVYFILPTWIYRYLNAFVIQLILLWMLRLLERVILVKTTSLWFYTGATLVFMQSDWQSTRFFPSYSSFYGAHLLGVLAWVVIVLLALAIRIDDEIKKAEAEGVDPPSGGRSNAPPTGRNTGSAPRDGGEKHGKRRRKDSK